MNELVAQIIPLFRGGNHKNIQLHDNSKENLRRFRLELTNLTSPCPGIKTFHIREGLSFLTMLLEVGKILDCNECDLVVINTDGSCPTCGFGSETEHEITFWKKL